MDSLPSELITIICCMACTDTRTPESGFTGISLSRVSRRFYACSRPFAFHSIYLRRPKDIIMFNELLKTVPEEHRHIEALHTPCPHVLPDNRRKDGPSCLDAGYTLEARKPEPISQDLDVLTALHSILQHTSSYLRILSIFWVSQTPQLIGITNLLPDFPLPKLEELHIDRYAYRQANGSQAALPQKRRPTPVLPNLRRLHVAGVKDPRDDPPRLFIELSVLAPRLEHLRMPSYFLQGRTAPVQPATPFASLQSVTIYASPNSSFEYSEDNVRHIIGAKEPKYDVCFDLLHYKDTRAGDWERRWDDYLNGRIEKRDEAPWVIW